MDRSRDHFALPVWGRPLRRRKHGGGSSVSRDRGTHGAKLIEQAERLTERLRDRPTNLPERINPKLIFKLQLHPQATLDETQLGQLGLGLLARDPRRAIVVFPDESTLVTLRQRLREYAGLVEGGHQYAHLSAIEDITELTAEDRTGRRLLADPLIDEEVAALDIELWHSGDEEECVAHIQEIREFLEASSLQLLDWWVGKSLCLLRAQLTREAFLLLVEIDYVKEIDRRSQPTFEMGQVYRANLAEVDIEPLADDAVGIVVVDSGVMSAHPLLRNVIGDAQVFPDSMRTRIVGGADDGDQRTEGHGTAVAGIAIYDNIGRCLERLSFEPSAVLFSARVTDDNNEYDEKELIEHQLADAIEYFVSNYPIAKVINISLGDKYLIQGRGNS